MFTRRSLFGLLAAAPFLGWFKKKAEDRPAMNVRGVYGIEIPEGAPRYYIIGHNREPLYGIMNRDGSISWRDPVDGYWNDRLPGYCI